jgi:hypothetical protein
MGSVASGGPALPSYLFAAEREGEASMEKRVAEDYLQTVAGRDALAHMGSAGFEGYGQEAQAGGEAEAGVGVLPWDGDTVYRTKVLWNGDGEMLRVSERGRIIGWKESNVVAPHTTELADGSVRLRFTVFAPGQMSEWNPGRVGLLESFDIVFSPDRGEYVGAFQRQGEGILTTRGWRHDASPEGQLIAQIVGKWEPAPEDDSQWMAGMTIARDGTFRTKWNSFHNRHEVTDGLVRVESAETRTINLKRTCEGALRCRAGTFGVVFALVLGPCGASPLQSLGCAYIYAYVYVYVCTCTCTYIHIYNVHTHTVYVHICTYLLYAHACVCVCVCVCVYVYVYT